MNTWIQTYRGGSFDPLDPKAEEVDVRDIAHGLAMTCRYGGQCRRFYSVAEHSLLVARAAMRFASDYGLYVGDEPAAARSPEARLNHISLLGLLHDAAEAYIGDIVSPLKVRMLVDLPWLRAQSSDPEVGVNNLVTIEDVEQRILDVIAYVLAVPDLGHTERSPQARFVKGMDERIVADECRVLFPNGTHEGWADRINPLGVLIQGMHPGDAERAWLNEYYRLKETGWENVGRS